MIGANHGASDGRADGVRRHQDAALSEQAADCECDGSVAVIESEAPSARCAERKIGDDIEIVGGEGTGGHIIGGGDVAIDIGGGPIVEAIGGVCVAMPAS